MARNDGQGNVRFIFNSINTFEGYEFSRAVIAAHANSTLNTNRVTIAVYLEGRYHNPRNRQVTEGFSFLQATNRTFTASELLDSGFGRVPVAGLGSTGLIDARYFLGLDTPNSVLCALSNGSGRLIRRTCTVGPTRFDTFFGAETVVLINC
jgi:hypothetical protein